MPNGSRAPQAHSSKKTPCSVASAATAIERIVRSKYDTEGFMQTLKRMSGYANQSTPLHPQLRLGERDTAMVGEEQARVQRAQAEWLSTINLSSTSTWQFPLKTFPRPTGKATRVIMTEYDLPRPTIEPHDVDRRCRRHGLVFQLRRANARQTRSRKPAKSRNIPCPNRKRVRPPAPSRCAPTRKATCGSA